MRRHLIPDDHNIVKHVYVSKPMYMYMYISVYMYYIFFFFQQAWGVAVIVEMLLVYKPLHTSDDIVFVYAMPWQIFPLAYMLSVVLLCFSNTCTYVTYPPELFIIVVFNGTVNYVFILFPYQLWSQMYSTLYLVWSNWPIVFWYLHKK